MRGRAVWGRARNESESKTAPILALGRPDGITGLRRSGRPRGGTGGPEKKKVYVPADGNGPAAFERESGGIGRGGCAPPLPRGTKKASRTDFSNPYTNAGTHPAKNHRFSSVQKATEEV